MERGAGIGLQEDQYAGAASHVATVAADEYEYPIIVKKKPPKLKTLNRSISMAIDNYAPPSTTLIVEQPLIHRSASPLPMRATPTPPQTLLLSPNSPKLQQQQQQQQQQLLHQQMQQQQQQQPHIYLVSSSSLSEHNVLAGGSNSPIQFIDDYMLPSVQARHLAANKKTILRRSDTIDVQPASTFQFKKTHSFYDDPSNQSQLTASRRTSSVRSNFLLPIPTAGKDMSRSPSPSRRGYRSHRSFNDPQRRPSQRNESEARHASLSDELVDDTRSHITTIHPKVENFGVRKSSGSFEENIIGAAATHPPKKRIEVRPHSSHSLELDAVVPTQTQPTLQLHTAAAAATAAYHFKRGAQQARSLYLSPNNLEELPVHRSGVLAAAAAFQGTNASAKQVRALHTASVRLRNYRENLNASKKAKSFMADEFELTSPQRRNSRPGAETEIDLELIKRSPRPLSAAFLEEKRPSFERKNSMEYELGDAAFEQVLRPFHHKVAGRKASMSMKKKSLSDETVEDEEADRKRKRIVCIVMTVFLCLVCASVLVVILTLTHSSGQSQSHHHAPKKTYTFTRETPVHYNGMNIMFYILNKTK